MVKHQKVSNYYGNDYSLAIKTKNPTKILKLKIRIVPEVMGEFFELELSLYSRSKIFITPIIELKPISLLPLTYVVCCHKSEKKHSNANKYQIKGLKFIYIQNDSLNIYPTCLFCTVKHYVKNVRNRNYSGPHFPTFGLNTERY